VLPLQNLSPDPNDEYFTDGMTEELITSLSQLRELTVIARTSVMRYKGAARAVSEIGRELNAGSLIEGSVRKAGSRIRITVQLIDAKNEGHVWAQNYDRDMGDIFAIQSEIAESVARELEVRLVESEKSRLERKPTRDTEAYMLYLKGRFYWNERSETGLKKAIEYFDVAIKKDPAFALGYSGLSDCYGVMARNHLAEVGLNYEKAKQYALKALELDENLAEAHAALASVLREYEHNSGKAESEYKRAIELKPSYSSAHQWYSIFLGAHGRYEEGEREIRKALELDPLSLIINTNLGDWLYYLNKLDAAIEQYRKTIEIEPEFLPAHESVIKAYVRKGMYDEAMAEGKICSKLSNHPLFQKWVTASVCAAKGEFEESLRLLEQVEQGYRTENISPYDIALVHFAARDNEGGFQWLRRAYDEHDGWIDLMASDFELDGVRDDPRYLDILDKIGLGQDRTGRKHMK